MRCKPDCAADCGGKLEHQILHAHAQKWRQTDGKHGEHAEHAHGVFSMAALARRDSEASEMIPPTTGTAPAAALVALSASASELPDGLRRIGIDDFDLHNFPSSWSKA